MDTTPANELRALILAPVGRDAALSREALADAGIQGLICANLEKLAGEVELGAGMCVIAEESLATSDLSGLRDALLRQPPWSDLPILAVIRSDSSVEDVFQGLGSLGNVTPLVRPFRIQTLVNTARTLLRARRRQYQARDMMERLGESDRRKTRFLALLGHELRNPLAAIRWSVKTVASFPQPHERARHALAVIDRQSQNLTRMVDDLLDVSRITSGKIILRHEPVSLLDVCSQVNQMLEPAARAAGLTLATSLPSDRAVVDGDPVRLEQIVSNLVGNAIKYTPHGGNVSLLLSADACQGEALLQVRDDGIGIPAEMLGSVFEPFVQIQGVEGRSAGGLGLGLALVRDLVEMHGGKVIAESPGTGRGSTFSVSLPLSAREAAAKPDSASHHSPASPNAHPVLVIEDNDDIRELTATMIESWGYPVAVAGEGNAGLELAQSRRPRIALVDIGLPGIDGYEVARRMRELFPRGNTRLVAMTGFGQAEDRVRALQAGFDTHLVKPVEPDELRKLLVALGSGGAG